MARSEASKAQRREYNRIWRQKNMQKCVAYTRKYEQELKAIDPDYFKEKCRVYNQRWRERKKERTLKNGNVT